METIYLNDLLTKKKNFKDYKKKWDIQLGTVSIKNDGSTNIEVSDNENRVWQITLCKIDQPRCKTVQVLRRYTNFDQSRYQVSIPRTQKISQLADQQKRVFLLIEINNSFDYNEKAVVKFRTSSFYIPDNFGSYVNQNQENRRFSTGTYATKKPCEEDTIEKIEESPKKPLPTWLCDEDVYLSNDEEEFFPKEKNKKAFVDPPFKASEDFLKIKKSEEPEQKKQTPVSQNHFELGMKCLKEASQLLKKAKIDYENVEKKRKKSLIQHIENFYNKN